VLTLSSDIGQMGCAMPSAAARVEVQRVSDSPAASLRVRSTCRARSLSPAETRSHAELRERVRQRLRLPAPAGFNIVLAAEVNRVSISGEMQAGGENRRRC
jgi:hypothetical protein